jgi:hypothetical protein
VKRIKILSFAAVAALALIAVLGAAGASAASEFKTESSPTTITPSFIEGNQLDWHFHTAYQRCANGAEGTLSSTHAKEVEMTLKDTTCEAQFTGNQFKANGCKFTYRVGNQTGSSTFKGTIDIGPAGCGPISFTSVVGSSACQVTVPAQTGLSATFENVGSGKNRMVKVYPSTTNLKHTQVSGKDCGAEGLGTFTDGSISGSVKLQATNAGGAVGMWVEAPAVSIGGTPPKWIAGTYPISIGGAQNSAHVFNLPSSGKVECGSVNFHAPISFSTAQLSVTAEYGSCKAFGLPGTVSMNGCTYTFNVLNQPPVGASYAGHADIACPAGKAIEIVVNPSPLTPKCTITIAAQTTDSGGLTFTNETVSTVGLAMAMKGIDYHLQEGSGVGRCKTGDWTDGTYTGSSTLVGTT